MIRLVVLVTGSMIVLACQRGEEAGLTSAARSPAAVTDGGPAVDIGAIRAAVQNENRPEEDRVRDVDRKPADVLAFFGITPGMTVLDFNAGTGYYTELLSAVVGVDGHVIAHNHQGAEGVLTPEDFEARYGNNRLPNTEQVFASHNELDLVTGSLDAVIMTLVYHDTYWFDENVDWGPVDHAAFLAELYDAMKPGAVLGMVDHYAAPDSDPYESARATHRIDPDVVFRDVGSAGFEFVAATDLLRNSVDNYGLSVFDESVRGKTDRFVLRFRRPN